RHGHHDEEEVADLFAGHCQHGRHSNDGQQELAEVIGIVKPAKVLNAGNGFSFETVRTIEILHEDQLISAIAGVISENRLHGNRQGGARNHKEQEAKLPEALNVSHDEQEREDARAEVSQRINGAAKPAADHVGKNREYQQSEQQLGL